VKAYTVIALLFIPQFAAGDDVADLKAANQKMFQAWRDLDAAGVIATVSPGIVAYYPDAAFPDAAPMEVNEAATAAMMKSIMESLDYYNMTPYNPQFRVFGNTGLAWGHVTISAKPKGQPAQTMNLRYTLTWTKSDGKWLLVMTHYSAIPTGD
jgi:ketosteroid isomerase-like protein